VSRFSATPSAASWKESRPGGTTGNAQSKNNKEKKRLGMMNQQNNNKEKKRLGMMNQQNNNIRKE